MANTPFASFRVDLNSGRERLLREFGRDGKASLSVTFYDGHPEKDASRLKFMAETTAEISRLDDDGRARDAGAPSSAD